jgi:hypothetical protein
VVAQQFEQRALHFDYWLSCKVSGPSPILSAVLTDLLEVDRASRQRARTSRSNVNNVTMVDAILANLILAKTMRGDAATVAISLGHGGQRDRYQRDGFRSIRLCIEALSTSGWLTVIPSNGWSLRTVLMPSERLLDHLSEDLEANSKLTVVQGRETIVLRCKDVVAGRKLTLDYTDSPYTRKIREELGELSCWLTESNITLRGLRLPFQLRRTFSTDNVAGSSDYSWDRGGRLSGGWWMDLPRLERNAIQIEGEPIADLDFKAMFPRLAARSQGLELAADFDPYLSVGLPASSRPEVKQVVNAMLFTPSKLKAWPRRSDDSGLFLNPRDFGGTTLPKLRAMIIQHLPFMDTLEGSEIGHKLFLQESEVLLSALTMCHVAGIIALPMHDGIMVKKSMANEALSILKLASLRQLGAELPAIIKSIN